MMRYLLWLAVLAVTTVACAREDDAPMPDLGQTWIEIGGQAYGAKADERGPIGGGKGYTGIVTRGDYQVSTIDELLEALRTARPGQIVFVVPGAELDFTALVIVEDLVLEVPAGVTLASNRGQNGAPGALLMSDAFETSPLIHVTGPDVRITGLRIKGPDPKTRLDHHRRAYGSGRPDASSYYYALPNSNGITTSESRLEVDNCDISGWSHGGISLEAGVDHYIHHNYIHHCQRNGLGYGVTHGSGDQVVSLIEYNVFDANRHSIAGTGVPGNAYEACHNVELGNSISHHFDMHGGRDRDDGTTVAGQWMKVHHNTFRTGRQAAVVIRGVPLELTDIHHNWFAQREPSGKTVLPWPTGGYTNVWCHDNAWGVESPAVEVGDQ